MPIGFWAVSRSDLIELVKFWMEQYHKPKSKAPSPAKLNAFIKSLRERLDNELEDMVTGFVTEL